MRDYLRSIEAEAIAVLRELVEINSFTHNREGVVRNGDRCEELFAPLGFTARRTRSIAGDCGDHLILARAGREGAPHLLLVSHLDTVYPKNFDWREEGDRIYGPGVCDIKGGTVLIWMVLCALKEHRSRLFGDTGFTILFNASEEGGCADFSGIARAEVTDDTRACLVYEAGMDADAGSTVVVSRKGAAHFLMEATGREAHSGNKHEEGASAVRQLAGHVERIESLTDYERGVTFNVGMFRGGHMVNCVPSHASCLIDMRSGNLDDYSWGKAKLLAMAGEGWVTNRDRTHTCRVDVVEQPGYPPWAPNEASDRLGGLAVECGRELGLEIVPSRRGGASDGCHLCEIVPTLDGLGPVGRNAHRNGDENVDRASFVDRALLSVNLIERLL